MSQPYHVAQELYASCTRHLNSKSNPPKPVKVIQTWDGNRPDIKPLLQGCYIYLQALRLKKSQKEQREAEYFSKYHSHLYDKTRSGFCKYWRRGKDIDTNRKM